MVVQELIDILERYPKDAEVLKEVFLGYENEYALYEFELDNIRLGVGNNVWYWKEDKGNLVII